MAKQCMLQREEKRTKLVAKYSKKRKKILSDLKTANNLTEIFAMQKKLQRLPGNSLPIRLKNRCWKTGRSRGFLEISATWRELAERWVSFGLHAREALPAKRGVQ